MKTNWKIDLIKNLTNNKNMNAETICPVKKFKDDYAIDLGFKNWQDYLDSCTEQGMNESEIGYDNIMTAYGNLILYQTEKILGL